MLHLDNLWYSLVADFRQYGFMTTFALLAYDHLLTINEEVSVT